MSSIAYPFNILHSTFLSGVKRRAKGLNFDVEDETSVQCLRWRFLMILPGVQKINKYKPENKLLGYFRCIFARQIFFG